MRKLVSFWIPGTPMPKARHRDIPVWTKGGKLKIVVRGGKEFPIMNRYTDPKTKAYEKLIANTAKKAMYGRSPTRKPVRMDTIIYNKPADSTPAWKMELICSGRLGNVSRPDHTNVVKAIEDGMNEIVYNDDCQIIESTTQKRYSEKEGVLVSIIELDMYPSSLKTLKELNAMRGEEEQDLF